MADALLKVAFAGPHVSWQDGGRPGFLRFGVTSSGGMDRRALAIANLVLGKPQGAPVIEVSMGGLVLDGVQGDLTLALIGGGFIRQVGDQVAGSWQVFALKAGQRLIIRPGPWGNWTYLAALGQMEVPLWLGSASTHVPSGMGGGLVRTGAVIRVAEAETRDALHGPVACPVWARACGMLHAIPGPQDRFFPPDGVERFFHARFAVSPAFDRMGIRLTGPALPPVSALSIPSEPIVRGSVQVSGDGVPTVLMADHQTTGGYPKIATILDDDLDAFAQCRPGQTVRFHRTTAEAALVLARRRGLSGKAYLQRLAAAPAR